MKKGIYLSIGMLSSPLQGEFQAAASAPNVQDIERGDKKKAKIALTFDGAYSVDDLDKILLSLKQHGSSSTFFLMGDSINKSPEASRMILDYGHEVGNHTYDHPRLTTYSENHKQQTRKRVDKNFIKSQLLRTADEFYRACGKEMAPLWRAPFGEENAEILKWAKEAGYQHVRWTLDSLDFVEIILKASYIELRTGSGKYCWILTRNRKTALTDT